MGTSQSESNLHVHVPVMLEEVLRLLNPQVGEVMLDGTVGLGGHAMAIAKRLGPTGLVIGLDRDAESLERAREALAGLPCRLLHRDYTEAQEVLEELGVNRVDGVLYDLGASQYQLKDPERGFSFTNDGPLDMRMDRSRGPTAADLVARLSERELEQLIREFGEERYARRIARRIANERKRAPIRTTGDLARLIASAVPRSGRIAPQTRTFQALRIAVNRELDCLRQALEGVDSLLRPGGRVVVISFHSLEDRLVKQAFRRKADEGVLELLTKKPVRPSAEEVARNRASRSARVRAARKVADR